MEDWKKWERGDGRLEDWGPNLPSFHPSILPFFFPSVSRFAFHVSRFTFHVSHVTFHMSRFALPILSIVILAYFLFSPTGDLAAQDASPPEGGLESQAEEPSDTSLDTTRQKPSAALDPKNNTPEEGKVIGQGDDMVIQNNFVQIHGNGLIKYEDVVLYAEHIWADFNENLMRAAGNVRLIIGNEETHANELIFNLETKKGIVREGFTYNAPWYYRGSEIFKVDEKESYIRGGSLTTCPLKYPHFYFSASQIIVKIDQELIAKNIVLRVGGVPLFYFPVYRRDLRKNKVAKVIVKLGTDSYQGPFLSVILPLSRQRRYDGALSFDYSARRGKGEGFDGKYRVNDVKFQEIFIPVPRDATPGERAKLEKKAEELSDRLEGEYDKYKLRQIFLEYKIHEGDIARAREAADKIYKELTAPDTSTGEAAPQTAERRTFAQIAQDDSAHQETRFQGGDMGFLVRGEKDAEGKPRLDPILEGAAFEPQPGEISSILRTDFAFHILKVDRALEVYGEREIQVRRIDIAIQPSDETRTSIQATANEIQKRASAGESFEQLAAAYPGVEVSQSDWTPLNEMDPQWRYSVRRLEKPGDVIPTVIQTNRGVYIFQLIEKQPTPTFEEVARQFEAEWEAMKKENEKLKRGREGEAPAEPLRSGEGEQKGKGGRVEGREGKEGKEGKEGREGDKGTEGQRDNTQSNEPEVPPPPSTRGTTGESNIPPAGGGGQEGGKEKKEKVYIQHGFRGSWEDARAVSSQAQQLDRGEASGVIKTRKGYHLIKVDKKRTYRGDLYFYTNDEYSFSRQDAFRTGQRWALRWGHYQSIYTPWDNREQGRRPVSFVSRVEWQARNFKEGFGESESLIKSFGVLTWGSAFSALDLDDRDPETKNLRFSNKTIGEFLGRLQVDHTLDLTGEGTTTLQKLPELTLSLSRMRLNGLPLFKTANSGLTKVAEKLHTDLPILSMFAFPTLEDTSFDLDFEFDNFFRQRYQSERDVFLQTTNLGFDLRKQSTLKVTPNRELRLDLNFQDKLI